MYLSIYQSMESWQSWKLEQIPGWFQDDPHWQSPVERWRHVAHLGMIQFSNVASPTAWEFIGGFTYPITVNAQAIFQKISCWLPKNPPSSVESNGWTVKKLCVVSEFETLKNHGIIMFHIFLFCGDKKKRNLAQQVTIFHASAHAELVGFLLWDILRWRVAECCPFWWVYLLENLQETNSIYRIFIVFTCMYFRLILFTSHFHEGKYCRPPTEKPGRLAIQTWGITKSSRTAQLLWFLDKRYEPALSTVP